MGYMAHHALVVHIAEYALKQPEKYHMPDIDAYRKTLPEAFQRLLIGPIETAINGDYVLALLPDGSKEGWDTSDTGDRIRKDLAAMFAVCYDDGSTPYDVVEVRFGGDDPELGYAIDPTRRIHKRYIA